MRPCRVALVCGACALALVQLGLQTYVVGVDGVIGWPALRAHAQPAGTAVGALAHRPAAAPRDSSAPHDTGALERVARSQSKRPSNAVVPHSAIAALVGAMHARSFAPRAVGTARPPSPALAGARPPAIGASAPGVRAPAPSQPAYVSIGAIFKGEHPFLIEWLEYHALIGVRHFFMVSNDCGADADASRALLAPYVRAGLVTLIREYECAPRGFQNDAYTLLLRRAAGATFWLMVVDIDEFIVTERDDQSVAEAMRPFERFDAVALMWRLFGTSGHQRAPNGAVLNNFRHRASTTGARDSRARSFKSIVRPEACVRMVTHMCAEFACQRDASRAARPSARCGCTASTDEHHCMDGRYLAMREKRPPFVGLWMHHYRTKSAEDWERKKERGRASVAEDARNSKRTGPPPDEYNCILDDALPRAVGARLARLGDAVEATRLRALLLAGPGPRLGSAGAGCGRSQSHGGGGGRSGGGGTRSGKRRPGRGDA
ncbi:hypothetical protein KFE25_001172 [Diacronema lutheri]|uniref:Glycosyltransferase family 92 protein n=1 Tax=Diacronema lutheri TaxID=2081491 RepID=A0A8J5X865_DIALT|nr:hypothetical protein KFE25_001172 [Diacronema lutheri]